MKTTKFIFYFLIIISMVFSFLACFSPWQGNEANLTLYLGGNEGADRAWGNKVETGALDYTITLTGPGDTQIIEMSNTTTVSTTVNPGVWNIQVTAKLGKDAPSTLGIPGAIYAVANLMETIQPGKNNHVSIKMTRAGDWIVGLDFTEAPTSITQGTSASFSVTLADKESGDVIWTVSGSASPDTGFGASAPFPKAYTTFSSGASPNTHSVILNVDSAEEPDTLLTVTAASATDPSKRVVAHVKVTGPGSITSVALTITEPVTGNVPDTTASDMNSTGQFSVGPLTWTPVDTVFQGGIPYTATLTLTTVPGYAFNVSTIVTINGYPAIVSFSSESTITVSYTFASTLAKTVTVIAVAAQPTQLTYTHGDLLDLSGLVATLTYDDSTTENVLFSDFTTMGITTSPPNNTQLSHTANNNLPVTLSINSLTENTGVLTVNQKALTVATATHTKIYDGSTTANGVGVTLNGILAGESVTGTVTAEYTSVDAGTTTITITAITLAGTDSTNYTVPLPANPITVIGGITKAEPTVTWPDGLNAVFGQTLSEISLALFDNTGGTPGTFSWEASGDLVGDAGVQTHAMTFTPTDTTNYNNWTNSVAILVDKAAGAAVTAPTESTVTPPTANSITVNAVTAPANGQTIEYAIDTSATATAGSLTWQSETSFSGLTDSTTYYVYARSAENTNYNAGDIQVTGITTTPPYVAQIGTTGYLTLEAAIADVPADNTLTQIRILDNFTSSGGYTIQSNQVIQLTVDTGSEFTIDLDLGNFAMFDVGSSATLTLGTATATGTLILAGYGPQDWNSDRCGIYVHGGTLEMYDNITIKGFYTSGDCGGVRVSNGGAFTMNGGTIEENETVNYGGGVSVNGNTDATFIMNGGTIKNNHASNGGGVTIGRGSGGSYLGAFTMTGGSIVGNIADQNGGGVYVGGTSGAGFTMSGGTIENNEAKGEPPFNYGGGGVFVTDSGDFTMSGGIIYGSDEPSITNMATGSGGAGASIYVNTGTAQYSGAYGTGTITTSETTLSGP